MMKVYAVTLVDGSTEYDLNLADRLSHQLAGETDPAAIHQVLTEEHRAALVELADG